jgi:hypothetical protein
MTDGAKLRQARSRAQRGRLTPSGRPGSVPAPIPHTPPPMPPRLILTLLLLALLTGACRSHGPAGMPREKFVRVNVALRLLPDSGRDVARRRAAILRREHVTAAQLQSWVRTARASTLAQVWAEIAAKVDSARTPTRTHRRPIGSQVGVPLTPPPAAGGPQDTLIRPTPSRPAAADTALRTPQPRPRLFIPPDTA